MRSAGAPGPRVAAVQMTSGDDVAANLARAGELLNRAAEHGALLARMSYTITTARGDKLSRNYAAPLVSTGSNLPGVRSSPASMWRFRIGTSWLPKGMIFWRERPRAAAFLCAPGRRKNDACPTANAA